jgi:hypothetical protein
MAVNISALQAAITEELRAAEPSLLYCIARNVLTMNNDVRSFRKKDAVVRFEKHGGIPLLRKCAFAVLKQLTHTPKETTNEQIDKALKAQIYLAYCYFDIKSIKDIAPGIAALPRNDRLKIATQIGFKALCAQVTNSSLLNTQFKLNVTAELLIQFINTKKPKNEGTLTYHEPVNVLANILSKKDMIDKILATQSLIKAEELVTAANTEGTALNHFFNFNQETGKVELNFGKADLKRLTEELAAKREKEAAARAALVAQAEREAKAERKAKVKAAKVDEATQRVLGSMACRR